MSFIFWDYVYPLLWQKDWRGGRRTMEGKTQSVDVIRGQVGPWKDIVSVVHNSTKSRSEGAVDTEGVPVRDTDRTSDDTRSLILS